MLYDRLEVLRENVDHLTVAHAPVPRTIRSVSSKDPVRATPHEALSPLSMGLMKPASVPLYMNSPSHCRESHRL